MTVNTEALCTLLKQAENVVWSLKDGAHIISDRHVIVRFDEIPREIKSVMLSIFLRDIEDGESICYRDGGVNSVKIGEIPCFKEANVIGRATRYLKECEFPNGDFLLSRVVQLGDKYILIQEKYMKLVMERDVVGFHEDNKPIFLADGAVMIFPLKEHGGGFTQSTMKKITACIQ